MFERSANFERLRRKLARFQPASVRNRPNFAGLGCVLRPMSAMVCGARATSHRGSLNAFSGQRSCLGRPFRAGAVQGLDTCPKTSRTSSSQQAVVRTWPRPAQRDETEVAIRESPSYPEVAKISDGATSLLSRARLVRPAVLRLRDRESQVFIFAVRPCDAAPLPRPREAAPLHRASVHESRQRGSFERASPRRADTWSRGREVLEHACAAPSLGFPPTVFFSAGTLLARLVGETRGASSGGSFT